METREYVRKTLFKQTFVLVIGIMLLVGAFVPIALGMSAKKSTNDAIEFNGLDDQVGEYCYLDVAGISEWVARYDDEYYYVAVDEYNYWYCVCLTKSEYKKMSHQLDVFYGNADADGVTHRIYGNVEAISSDLGDLLIEAADFEDIDELHLYLGNRVLNQ